MDAVNVVPDQLRRRTLAVRGFDENGMMTGWELIEGIWLEEAIERQFADPAPDISMFISPRLAATRPRWNGREWRDLPLGVGAGSLSHLMSLSGVKRTWLFALHMSADDPKRT